MKFLDFHKTFSPLGCFDINQIRAWDNTIDRTTIDRWVNDGLLIRLRNGLFAFNDWTERAGSEFVAANKVCRPSYVSLYSALSYYGMIPEFVAQTTSVTTVKTMTFNTPVGTFSFRHIKPPYFFGYQPIVTSAGQSAMFASPEKALLDLLYLEPSLKTADDMAQLRIDDDFLHEKFDLPAAKDIIAHLDNNALTQRFSLFLKAYNL